MNLLNHVTRGPYITSRGKRGFKSKLSGENWTSFASVYIRMDDAAENDFNPEGVANAKLLAASYDNTLLLAAVTTGYVEIESFDAEGMYGPFVHVYEGSGTSVTYDLSLSEFGTPELTPELRAALQRVVLAK